MSAIKGILNTRLNSLITSELLQKHGVYEEVKSWFIEMNKIYEGDLMNVKY